MVESDESGQQLNYTEPASTRLSSQTYEKYVEYINQEDVGKSEGLRRLVRSGLDHELDEDNSTDKDTSTSNLLLIFGVILSIAVAAGYLTGGGDPDQSLAFLAAAMVITGYILHIQNNE